MNAICGMYVVYARAACMYACTYVHTEIHTRSVRKPQPFGSIAFKSMTTNRGRFSRLILCLVEVRSQALGFAPGARCRKEAPGTQQPAKPKPDIQLKLLQPQSRKRKAVFLPRCEETPAKGACFVNQLADELNYLNYVVASVLLHVNRT